MTKQEFLAMSLPYGLKCCTVEINRINDLISCHFGNMVIARIKPNDDIDFPLPIAQIKPILHPLSDLTKPIEHKGKIFVPKDVLNQRFKSYGLNGCDKLFDMVDFKTNSTFHIWPFEIVLKLIEWHFAVGLNYDDYIDVNSLDVNPYK